MSELMTVQEQEKNKIIFIYNANAGGPLTGFKDTLHKTFRKSTYQCNLCQVTFGAFGMKKDWKNFVNKEIENPVEFMKKDKFKFEFLHRDEFEDKYVVENAQFPSAYIEKEHGLEVFITQDEMNAVKTIEELKELVNKRLKEFSV
jgi:hypothetical protein